MNVFGIGLPEMAVIGAVALLVFGPKTSNATAPMTAISGRPIPNTFMSLTRERDEPTAISQPHSS